jgi:serine/threonine-protein kinase
MELLRHLIELGWVNDYQIRQLASSQGIQLRLGNYVLLRPLGTGGMGQVFKACRHGSKDIVALKIVLPDLTTDPAALKQFRWEIQALSRMSHPNIIKTYDAGEDVGRHFFTMEYIEGTDLSKILNQYGPFPVARACNYIRQAAQGLEHAHEHCLIHRDIKPANLLLTLPPGVNYKPGDSGVTAQVAVIKVLDWGLAGLRPPTELKKTLTPAAHETSIGTADYMSPEQAVDMTKTDIRADIYSLGCTLYHLLAGQPPFPDGNFMKKIHMHQTAEPAALSGMRSDVPVVLAEVIKRMMAKKPADRYRAPALVAGALAPYCKE